MAETPPDWSHNWTVAEGHDALADFPEYQAELPVYRIPADTRLDAVWRYLTHDCRLMLSVKRQELVAG